MEDTKSIGSSQKSGGGSIHAIEGAKTIKKQASMMVGEKSSSKDLKREKALRKVLNEELKKKNERVTELERDVEKQSLRVLDLEKEVRDKEAKFLELYLENSTQHDKILELTNILNSEVLKDINLFIEGYVCQLSQLNLNWDRIGC